MEYEFEIAYVIMPSECIPVWNEDLRLLLDILAQDLFEPGYFSMDAVSTVPVEAQSIRLEDDAEITYL